ncbi:hypothetical protein HK097_010000 [Rhizophlyctis rosea]|uniref:Uncharacterized protein n=1 Tax=Rhizophlyctis rosea TaxID=64517 RepID=A0AAD5SAJ3_9FUNG|nr:hypothetical protein HK097_010000 [Rhizophlyctis rosea]
MGTEMSKVTISTSLPSRIIEDLRSAGATVREDCEIKIVELVTPAPIAIYETFLKSPDNVDPVLNPLWGHPLAPYVPANVQVEVWQLLATYQPLLAAAFAPGAPVAPLAPVPLAIPIGGHQYHHAQIAIQQVMQEIETSQTYRLPGLTVVPSGNAICDLQIIYSNCMVVRRIRKLCKVS